MVMASDDKGYDLIEDHEHRLLIQKFGKLIDMNMVNASNAEIITILNHSPYTPDSPAHLIVDFTDVEHIALKLSDTRNSSAMIGDKRLFWIIIVGTKGITGGVINFFANIATQLAHKKFRSFPTMEETMAFLQSDENPFR